MPIDTVAWFGSALVVASLMQRDAMRLHAINVVASVVFIVYDVALSLHPMTVLNGLLAIVSVAQIVRVRRRVGHRHRWRVPRVTVPVRVPYLVPDPLAATRR